MPVWYAFESVGLGCSSVAAGNTAPRHAVLSVRYIRAPQATEEEVVVVAAATTVVVVLALTLTTTVAASPLSVLWSTADAQNVHSIRFWSDAPDRKPPCRQMPSKGAFAAAYSPALLTCRPVVQPSLALRWAQSRLVAAAY